MSAEHAHEHDQDAGHEPFEVVDGLPPLDGPEPADWEQMTEDLMGLVAMGGFALSFISPTGGNVLMNRAPRATEALIELAKRDARLQSFLVRFLGRARYAALMEVAVEVALGVGVDYGVVPAQSPLLRPIETEVQQTMEMVAQMRQAQAQAQAEADAAEAQAAAAAQQSTEPAPAAAPGGES